MHEARSARASLTRFCCSASVLCVRRRGWRGSRSADSNGLERARIVRSREETAAFLPPPQPQDGAQAELRAGRSEDLRLLLALPGQAPPAAGGQDRLQSAPPPHDPGQEQVQHAQVPPGGPPGACSAGTEEGGATAGAGEGARRASLCGRPAAAAPPPPAWRRRSTLRRCRAASLATRAGGADRSANPRAAADGRLPAPARPPLALHGSPGASLTPFRARRATRR